MKLRFLICSAVLLLLAGCDTGGIGAPKGTPSTQPNSAGKVALSDAQWKQILTERQYLILRQKGTEAAFNNEFESYKETGTYVCAGCGFELYNSANKYDSRTGWPSFYQPIAADHITITKDEDGIREEALCARCDGHLGHVFDDGPQPTGKRHCINSAAMKFIPAK